MQSTTERRHPAARARPAGDGSGAAGIALLGRPDAGRAGPRLAAAAARAARSVPAATPQAAAVRDVAAGIAAPILIGYVLWLLLDARDRGLARLYFLSRDGQVLKEIADILAPRIGGAPERRYLLASRQAWNRALGRAHFDLWLWNDTAAAPSPAELLRRLDVPLEAVAGELAGLGFGDPERPLAAGEADRMRAWLGSGRFAAAAAAAAAESRALLDAYLDQEGLYDEAPMAIVDLGWTGSQHETLCSLRAGRDRRPAACYLFGAKARASAWSGLRRGFYFDEGRDGPVRHALPPGDLYVLMETFCASADGTLTGFRRAGGRVVPACAPDREAELAAWGLPLLRRTLRAAARAVDVDGLEARDLRALQGTIGRLLETFWTRPTAEEAHTWGAFPWDAGQGHEAEARPLAEPYRLADVSAGWKPRRLRKREIFWVEGALAMTPPPVAATLNGLAACRARLGQARRRLARWSTLWGLVLASI